MTSSDGDVSGTVDELSPGTGFVGSVTNCSRASSCRCFMENWIYLTLVDLYF